MMMIRSTALLLLFLVPLGLQAQVPSAASETAGEKIVRFEVSGNTSVASDTIRVYLGIVPGAVYDPGAIQRNFANLWQTGLFDDIRVEADRVTEGIVVRAIVIERPRIGAIEYRGNKNLSASKIQEALESARVELHIGSTVEQTQIRRAAEQIRNAYAEGGYEGVSVEAELEDMITAGEKRIVFNVNEGIKARISGIDFTGNERFSDRRLRTAMKEVKRHNIVSWIRRKNLYIPSKLDEDLEKVRNVYLDHGYRQVEIGEPQIVTAKGRRPRVRVTVPIKEGPVHQFRSVSVSGNTVFTEEQMIGRWPLGEGDVLSRKAIQGRIDFFEDLYRRRGYIYAYINPEYTEIGENVNDVHLNVYEGEQFRLGRLEFQGNTVTKDKVLRREIFVSEGDILNMENFKASMYKLGQLGYFKVTENPDFKVNPESKTVDVIVKGREEGKNDIQFGGGYSEAYGFFAQFQFQTRNFLGEGESVGVAYQRGRRQDFFSLSYADPWFRDRPHTFAVSLFNRQTTLPESIGFESTGQGGSIGYGFRTGRFQSISFLYAFEDRHESYNAEFQMVPDDNGNVPLPDIQDEDFTTSTFAPSYRFDSRDNPFDTSRGTRFNLSLGYTGGPLGGTLELTKPVMAFSYFRPLSRRTTWSANVEGGKIFANEDDNCAKTVSELTRDLTTLCVPRSERFYVGGEQSVRGFRYGTIGDFETSIYGGKIYGGHSFTVFNTEYIYRVNDPLRFVLFADGGYAYGRNQDFDLSKLRYSVGAEMRIFLPVFQFPLRFIYSFNPDSRPGDLFETFQFSIGNTF
jgi:outer membrane protein insertion porin family